MALFRVGLPFVLLTCSLSCLMVHFLPFYIPPPPLSLLHHLSRSSWPCPERTDAYLSLFLYVSVSKLPPMQHCLIDCDVLFQACLFNLFKKTGPVWNKILKERRFFTFLVSFLTVAPLFRSNPVYEDNSRVTDHCFRNNSFVIGDSS